MADMPPKFMEPGKSVPSSGSMPMDDKPGPQDPKMSQPKPNTTSETTDVPGSSPNKPAPVFMR